LSFRIFGNKYKISQEMNIKRTFSRKFLYTYTVISYFSHHFFKSWAIRIKLGTLIHLYEVHYHTKFQLDHSTGSAVINIRICKNRNIAWAVTGVLLTLEISNFEDKLALAIGIYYQKGVSIGYIWIPAKKVLGLTL
jgi:hypothetical protein